MADYAWSQINCDKGVFQPGDSVSAEKLGVSKEDYDALKEAGSVREEKYPDMGDFDGSPTEFAKRELAIASGAVLPDEVDGVGVVKDK